jgi:hypothetical protein
MTQIFMHEFKISTSFGRNEWKNTRIVTTKNTEFDSLFLRSDMRLTGERPGQVKQALRIGERALYYVSNTSESSLRE